MKKFLLLILICAAGYFVYDNFIKKEKVLDIKADKSISTSYSDNINAPALSSAKSGTIEGTVKNVSDKPVTNIILRYKFDTKPAEARIDKLEPGETKNFSTQSVKLLHDSPSFYLEEMSYK
ncbi:MAG TPA: FxLYD domain-containing protein [Ignavibacteriaceae bacterium]|nr:FxLYD domain-containing protein [Ignavibacteriaceae bacterium]